MTTVETFFATHVGAKRRSAKGRRLAGTWRLSTFPVPFEVLDVEGDEVVIMYRDPRLAAAGRNSHIVKRFPLALIEAAIAAGAMTREEGKT